MAPSHLSPADSQESNHESRQRTSDASSDLIQDVKQLEFEPQVFPNEILLAIMAQSPASTLVAFTQLSFACLVLASPLLYQHVTISNSRQARLFFVPEPITSTSFPHLHPHFARTQTKHLSIIPPPETTDNDASPLQTSPWTPSHCFLDGDAPLLPSGPLLLDSYSNPLRIGYFRAFINPSMLVSTLTFARKPTLLAEVRPTALSSTATRRYPAWTRLQDFVLQGSLPYSKDVAATLVAYGTNCRFTLDLSMIEQKVDPTNPKGSCQRLLEEFGTSLNGARGRVWVGSRGMLETFEVAKEELRKRLEGGKLGKELGKISVELSKL